MLNKISFVCSTIVILMTGIGHASAKQSCYTVEGTIATENISTINQVGTISITVTEDDTNDIAFSNAGSLYGTITGNEGFSVTLLSHVINFSNGRGNRFVTNDDRAEIVFPYVLNTLDDGTPCSFFIHETIRNVSQGTGFFKRLTNVELFADGFISNCPGKNENQFELSGGFCKK